MYINYLFFSVIILLHCSCFPAFLILKTGIQKDATGKLTRGYRAHLSLVERELAQLQTDVPEWANPNSPMDENNENGIKMTQMEKESYINDRKAVWTEYRSDCERLAHDMIDTQLLLDRHEEHGTLENKEVKTNID